MKNKLILILTVVMISSLLLLNGCANALTHETEAKTDELPVSSIILRYEAILKQQELEIHDLLNTLEQATSSSTIAPPETDTMPGETETAEESTQKPNTPPSARPNEVQTNWDQNQTEQDSFDVSNTPTPSELFTWEEINGGIRLTGLTCKVESLVIPNCIDKKPVIAIADNAFAESGITTVKIEEGVQEIGWFAFWQCASLSSIELPVSVKDIGYAAFDGCAKNFTICCVKDSYAYQFATSFGIPVDPMTIDERAKV